MSGGNVAQWIGFRDQWGYFLALDSLYQIAKDLWLQNRTSVKAQILKIQGPNIQFHNRASDGPCNRIPPSRAQHVQQAGPFLTGDQVNHDIHTVSTQFGDQIIAVHVGMASDRLCHYWFPAFEPDHSRLSPGVLLLVEMARTAGAIGHLGVELGPGDYGFKKDLSSSQTGLVSGRFTTPSLRGGLARSSQALAEACSRAPLGPARHWPDKVLRKLGRVTGFQAL